MKNTAQKKAVQDLVCPVCSSTRLDPISIRMSKCLKCGFIWNHEVSERDNILLIVEHQTKWAASKPVVKKPAPKLQVFRAGKAKRLKKKSGVTSRAH